VPLYEGTVAVYRELATDAPDAGFVLASEPAGLLLVAQGRGGLQELAARIAADAPDLRTEVVDGVALRSLEPLLADGVAAVRLPIGFPVVPSAPTYAMATLAERRGATFRLGRSVRPIVEHGRAIGVEVDGRTEGAGAVVVAAGPWTSELVEPSGRWRPIRPLWGVVVEVTLASHPHHVLEQAFLDAVTGDGAAGRAESDFSLVPTGGDVCAVGSTFLDDEPALDRWRDRLLEQAIRYVPSLYDAPIREVRACSRPLSADRRPLIGRVDSIDGLYVCAGHGPWGISTGPGSAALLADLIVDGDGAIDGAFDPARFPLPA
jgi:glycine/D-amino acid oxidase-like deaminating enzyme